MKVRGWVVALVIGVSVLTARGEGTADLRRARAEAAGKVAGLMMERWKREEMGSEQLELMCEYRRRQMVLEVEGAVDAAGREKAVAEYAAFVKGVAERAEERKGVDMDAISLGLAAEAVGDAERVREGLRVGNVLMVDRLEEGRVWKRVADEKFVGAIEKQSAALRKVLDAIEMKERIVSLSPEFMDFKARVAGRLSAILLMRAADEEDREAAMSAYLGPVMHMAREAEGIRDAEVSVDESRRLLAMARHYAGEVQGEEHLGEFRQEAIRRGDLVAPSFSAALDRRDARNDPVLLYAVESEYFDQARMLVAGVPDAKAGAEAAKDYENSVAEMCDKYSKQWGLDEGRVAYWMLQEWLLGAREMAAKAGK